MKLKSFRGMNCSLAQTLEVVGERWTLLILRDAFLGAKRFEQFQNSLGIARNILTMRLNHLVAEGILDRRPIEGGRFEYVLTDKGLDLQPVLLSMTHWGDKHQPNPKGTRLVFVERDTGKPIQAMAVHSAEGRPLKPRDIKAKQGPGLR
ncbi:MAG: helix-turn-helix transcriptional regulator [Gammaproteobacteria bacterium]|nr:helix-turn-helix transcriptional regulator [Gammaproteobacteria bacterium]